MAPVVLMLLLHQIDLDTIETSNLNRQFLFRRAHVSQSKAQVAADVVKTFAPQANIKAYQVSEPAAAAKICLQAQQTAPTQSLVEVLLGGFYMHLDKDLLALH